MRNVVSSIMILMILFSSFVVFAPKGFAGAPVISTVSRITATRLQTIYIYGSGFGNTWPQIVSLGDGSVDTVQSSTTPYLIIGDHGKYQKTGDPSDGGENWAAGIIGTNVYAAIGIILTSWSDNEIVLGGFGSALGVGQGTWYIAPGDPITVTVVTSSGQATYNTQADALPYPQLVGYYLASYPDGIQFPSNTPANFGEPYEIVVQIKNPDTVPHTYKIEFDFPTSVSIPTGAPIWNWPGWLAGPMAALGAPGSWDADPQCKYASSSGWFRGSLTEFASETVQPGHTANFVYSLACKWNWIPPWDIAYLISCAVWNIEGGRNLLAGAAQVASIEQAVMDAAIVIWHERFGFQVSLIELDSSAIQTTVLQRAEVEVKVPPTPKFVQYVNSIVASFPAGVATAAAIAGSETIAPLTLLLLQGGLILAQNLAYVQAADPSSDYTLVVQPVPLALLNGTEVMKLPAVTSLTGTMYNVVDTLVSFLEYQNATTISIERYAGAGEAGDQYYRNLQLQALTRYASQRDLLFAVFENQLSILSPVLPTLNLSSIENVKNYLSQNGLPIVEQQILAGLGLSSSIPDITTGLEVLLNVASLNATILSQFSLVNGTQAMLSLLMAETSTWEQQLSPGVNEDVAVTDVTPYRSYTYQGSPINLNVTVTNLEGLTENTTISLYYDSTMWGGTIGTETVLLAPNQAEMLTFTWNTTAAAPCGEYTITAVADILPVVDSNLTNNLLQSRIKVAVDAPPTTSVGGEWTPIDTTQLVTPWILLALFAFAAACATSHRLLKKRR